MKEETVSDYEMNDAELEAFENWHGTTNRNYSVLQAWDAAFAFAAKHGYTPPEPPKCIHRYMGRRCVFKACHRGEHRAPWGDDCGPRAPHIVWPNEDECGAK